MGELSGDLPAATGGVLRRPHRDIFHRQEMLSHGHALDQRSLGHLRNRKRRFLVNLFRNK